MFPPSFEIFCGDKAIKFHNKVEPFAIKMEQLTARLINLRLFPQFSYNCYRSRPELPTQGFVFLQTEEGFCKTILPIEGIYDERSVWCVVKYRGQKLNKKQLEKAEKQMWFIFECEPFDHLELKEKIMIREAVARFNIESKERREDKRNWSEYTEVETDEEDKMSEISRDEPLLEEVPEHKCEIEEAPEVECGTRDIGFNKSQESSGTRDVGFNKAR